MSNLHDVKIKKEGSGTKVFIDGKELKGIRKVIYIEEVNNTPVLRVDMYTKVATIDSACILDVSNAFERK